MEITIKAFDGKIFTGTTDIYSSLIKEVNEYEAKLRLKNEKEEALKKEQEKAFAEIENIIEQLNTSVKEFELATNKQTFFAIVNRKLAIKKYSTLPDGLIKEFFGF